MRDLIVVAACTRRAGMLAEYERQLSEAGIDFRVDHIEHMPNGCGNLGVKVDGLRRHVAHFGDYQKIVISDAWDVLFYGTKEEIMAKIPDEGILMAAERNCWPDQYLSDYFPGTTPWRFVNGGLMCGTVKSVGKWLDEIEAHPAYMPQMIDQQWFNHRRMQGSPLTPLDETANLFYCMFKESGELSFEYGKPVNTLTGTRPNFIHFNGKWDATNFIMLQTLSLQQERPILDAGEKQWQTRAV